VIVRISGEGQYRLDDTLHDELNRLDDAVVEAVEAGDEARFSECFGTLLAFVREGGEALPDDALEPSELILPPGDLSFHEAAEDFTGEGLIPNPPTPAA
jgi:hypothetical protein